MKVLILAAGYGTRLSRDLKANPEYSHLVGVAKPLLPVAGQPLISHWMDILRACAHTWDKVYVVVNALYHSQFEKWAEGYQEVELVSDGTTCNEDRIGAVACIQLAVRHFAIQDNLTVIGGDTLFLEDFCFPDFVTEFDQLRCGDIGGALVSCYNCTDDETTKLGIVEVDVNGRICSFLEKPSPDATQSRRACPCFYMLSKESLPLLSKFLQQKADAPLAERDATGHFVKYLSSQRAVFIKDVAGRFDVGGLQSYIQCCEQYKARDKN